MRRMKKISVLLMAFLLPVLLSGCWDYREVESLTLVAGMAIDRGQNGGKYHLTFECIQMAGGQQTPSTQPMIVETEGNTIFEAVRDALKISQKRLYFNPCRVIILSEDLARDGIKPVLDWSLRDAEPRITEEILVSKEKTASEILKQEPQPGQLNSYLISDLLRGTEGFSGETSMTRLYEVNNILNSDGVSLVLPGVSVNQEVGDSKLELSGTAVFKEDKLIGWLEDEQTKYLNFILNRISEGLISTSDSSENGETTLEILGSSTKVKPVVENGTVKIKIEVTVSAALGEQENKSELPGEESINKAETEVEQTLKNGIGDLISQVQKKYDSDIFGFGSTIYQKYPDEWEKLKPVWDKEFRNLKCEADVKVKIRNTALTHAEKGGG